MGKYFGTDGIRGIVYKELTPDLAFRIGNALSGCKRNIKVLIGRDTRLSGKMISLAVACGIMSGGGDVFDVGILTTPGVAYLTKKGEYDFGIMITASHNSAEYNGIKIFDKDGNKIDEKLEDILEKKLKKIKYAQREEIGDYKLCNKEREKYINYLINFVDQKLDNLKIVIDCANGAGAKIAPEVFKKLGAKVIAINTQKNGRKINYKCGALYTEKLRQVVLSKKAYIGIALDGDGDRLVIVDEKGNILDGDDLIFLFTRYLKSQNMLSKDTIVVTQMSNLGMEKELNKEGIKVIRTDVGDRNVAKRMEEGYVLGGEQCGHIIIKKEISSGDGIFAGIFLINILLKGKLSLSKTPKFKPFFQLKHGYNVRNKNEIMKNEHIVAFLKFYNNKLEGRGRVFLRPSGTENLLRILIESEDSDEVQKIYSEIEEIIKEVQ